MNSQQKCTFASPDWISKWQLQISVFIAENVVARLDKNICSLQETDSDLTEKFLYFWSAWMAQADNFLWEAVCINHQTSSRA